MDSSPFRSVIVSYLAEFNAVQSPFGARPACKSPKMSGESACPFHSHSALSRRAENLFSPFSAVGKATKAADAIGRSRRNEESSRASRRCYLA